MSIRQSLRRILGRISPDIALLVLALGIRALHFAGMLGDPLMAHPTVDARYHDEWARRILSGEAGQAPFFRAPLYPYVLSLLYAITGGSIVAAKAIQLALGAFLPLVVLRIGRIAFSPRVALGAATLAAIYPVSMRLDGELLVEGLFVLLATLGLLRTLRALAQPTPGRWLVAGLLLGLAAVTRPTILLFVFTLPWLALTYRSGTRRDALRTMLGLVAGVALPILPVTVHNALAGDPSPIATQGGINFYIGNNAHADGFTAAIPGMRAGWEGFEDAARVARADTGRDLRPSGVSDYWFRKAVSWMSAHPIDALTLTVRKVYLFWWGAEISNNEHMYIARRWSLPQRWLLGDPGIFIPFGLVAPLALVGLLRGGLRRDRRVLFAFLVTNMLAVVLFFVCARFRYPVLPVVFLYAAFGAATFATRRWTRRHVAWLGLLLTFGVALNADPLHLRPTVHGSQAMSCLERGMFALESGRNRDAIPWLREATELDPLHPGPHLALGTAYWRLDHLEEAVAEFELATRGDPVAFRDILVQAERNRGYVEWRLGRPDVAVQAFRRALALDAEHGPAWTGLGRVLAAVGDSAGARAALLRATKLGAIDEAGAALLQSLGDE